MSSNFSFISHREELELGVMIASEFMPEIHDGKLDSSMIRSALREVVEEIGAGHTDDVLVEKTVQHIKQIYSSVF